MYGVSTDQNKRSLCDTYQTNHEMDIEFSKVLSTKLIQKVKCSTGRDEITTIPSSVTPFMPQRLKQRPQSHFRVDNTRLQGNAD